MAQELAEKLGWQAADRVLGLIDLIYVGGF